MIRAAICEDNEIDLSHLRSLLENCGIPLEIAEYANGETLLWDVETGSACFDIYLLDIYLTGISGIETARRIHMADENAVLIFTTVSAEFCLEAFSLFAFNYLVKPVEQAALNTVMEKAAAGLRRRQETVLPITYRGCTSVLRYEEIEYISSSKHTLYFHLHNGEEKMCYGKLDELAEQIKSKTFLRCHQSYIVNLRYVLERTPEGIRMTDTVIPVSRTYAENTEKAINQRLFTSFENA